MLKALKAYAMENGIECYISLEEKMACGIGACLGCVCHSKDIDEHSNVRNKRICKDGPVFRAEEVELLTPDEQRERIEKRMYAAQPADGQGYEGLSHSGIALRNVHQRLQLLYGPDYGVSILSSQGRETVFVVSLPLTWIEGDEE